MPKDDVYVVSDCLMTKTLLQVALGVVVLIRFTSSEIFLIDWKLRTILSSHGSTNADLFKSELVKLRRVIIIDGLSLRSLP